MARPRIAAAGCNAAAGRQPSRLSRGQFTLRKDLRFGLQAHTISLANYVSMLRRALNQADGLLSRILMDGRFLPRLASHLAPEDTRVFSDD
jgi:hypothetical protein